jgi:hypothetical protein
LKRLPGSEPEEIAGAEAFGPSLGVKLGGSLLKV